MPSSPIVKLLLLSPRAHVYGSLNDNAVGASCARKQVHVLSIDTLNSLPPGNAVMSFVQEPSSCSSSNRALPAFQPWKAPTRPKLCSSVIVPSTFIVALPFSATVNVNFALLTITPAAKPVLSPFITRL